MADGSEAEVKDVERVEIAPAGGENVDQDDTEQESSPAENNEGQEGAEGEEVDPEKDPADESPDGRPEGLSQRQPQVPVPQAQGGLTADDLKEVPGETPRERALRLEVTRLRRQGKEDRVAEIMGTAAAPAASRKELSPEAKKVLEKYKPEEISALKEVLPVLAEEMGFVRQDQLQGQTFAERSQEVLDGFLEKHPEYLPENDTDGTLWNAFKTEFGLYKTPANPKEFARIFEKVHQSVFGIKTGKTLQTKVNAEQRKVQVASHAGAPQAAAPRQQQRRAAAPAGLRTDMLKGFSDDEISDIESRASGE